MMKSKVANTVDTDMMTPGASLFVYIKYSKKSEMNQWIEENIQKDSEHIFTYNRMAKRPPMRVSSGDIRMNPNWELSQELIRI